VLNKDFRHVYRDFRNSYQCYKGNALFNNNLRCLIYVTEFFYD